MERGEAYVEKLGGRVTIVRDDADVQYSTRTLVRFPERQRAVCPKRGLQKRRWSSDWTQKRWQVTTRTFSAH